MSPESAVAQAAHAGLTSPRKFLPPWLFYDAAGSELYEQITTLPEYYLTRAEQAIFEEQATEIVQRVSGGDPEPLVVLELGAGTATKTQILLRAIRKRQDHCRFLPADVSMTALEIAASRIRAEEPGIEVTPVLGYHERACEVLAELPERQLVLFIGSSIGNFDTPSAVALLTAVRRSLRPGAALLLGADLAKSPETLIPAYDDAAGVTAAFNKNLLVRLNRELGANFVIEEFRHVALWNAASSSVEMHLESRRAQVVDIPRLRLRVEFDAGERIHTESSTKYTLSAIESLLAAAGLTREHTFYDPDRRFGLHLGRAQAR